jgi:hypothetical protein
LEEIGLIDCKVDSYSDVLLPSMYGNEVSESLKTLILKMHLRISRPTIVNKTMILAALKKQLSFEKYLLIKARTDKYQYSIWKKVEHYLNT